MIDAPASSRFGAYTAVTASPSTSRRFSPRQRELIDRLVALESIVAAAKSMGISVHTARVHVRHIAQRLPNPHGLPPLKLILSYSEALR